jgi:hypothetical protein
VFVSSRSPTAESAGLVTQQQMRAAHWIRLSGGHLFAWHENRLRPVPFVSGAGRRVAEWSILLLVDGRPVTLTGSEWYAAQPRRLLWALPAVAAMAVAAIVLATRRERLIRMVAAIGLVLAWCPGSRDGSESCSTSGSRPGRSRSASFMRFRGYWSSRRPSRRPSARPSGWWRWGVVGCLVATFTLPALGVFQRGFVLSALPAAAARACVTLALGCGLGVALLAVPSLVGNLRRTHPTGVPARGE